METKRANGSPVMEIGEIEFAAMQNEAARMAAYCVEASANHGVKIPKRVLQTRRKISYDDLKAMIGVETSVKMNFIPQMLTAVAHNQAMEIVTYCANNRISEVKKLTRMMRQCVEEYNRRLAEAYGNVGFRAYMGYVDRYADAIYADCVKMIWYAESLAKNQHPGCRHPELAAKVLVVLMLVDRLDKIDDDNDKLLETKANTIVHTPKDVYLQTIKAMCTEMRDTHGYAAEPDDTMKLWIGILANRASLLASGLLEEECGDELN